MRHCLTAASQAVQPKHGNEEVNGHFAVIGVQDRFRTKVGVYDVYWGVSADFHGSRNSCSVSPPDVLASARPSFSLGLAVGVESEIR